MLVACLGGCAGYTDWRQGNKLLDDGQIGQGLEQMQQASKENPQRYRMKFIAERDRQASADPEGHHGARERPHRRGARRVSAGASLRSPA